MPAGQGGLEAALRPRLLACWKLRSVALYILNGCISVTMLTASGSGALGCWKQVHAMPPMPHAAEWHEEDGGLLEDELARHSAARGSLSTG